MRKLLLGVLITVIWLTLGSEGTADKDRPQFLNSIPKGETISHYCGSLRMAFPTIETLDPKNRPAKPKPFDQKPVSLQIHRVVFGSKNPQRILLGSDDKTTTTFWTRLYEGEGDLPQRLVSCVGMPEAEWILDTDTHVICGDLKVRGFRLRVTLRDYQHPNTTTGKHNVTTNVVHVFVENINVQKPGELVFSLPTSKQRTFVLSQKQGLFVFFEMAMEGSPAVQMTGWKEKPGNLPNKPDSGDGK